MLRSKLNPKCRRIQMFPPITAMKSNKTHSKSHFVRIVLDIRIFFSMESSFYPLN